MSSFRSRTTIPCDFPNWTDQGEVEFRLRCKGRLEHIFQTIEGMVVSVSFEFDWRALDLEKVTRELLQTPS